MEKGSKKIREVLIHCKIGLTRYYDPLLDLGDNKEERQFNYRELFNQHLDSDQIHDIREALNQELVYGREDFKEKIEQIFLRQTRRGKDGRPCIKEILAEYIVD